MTKRSRTLVSSFPVSLGLTATSHGWVRLPPFDWDGAALWRLERISGNRIARARLVQKDRLSFRLTITGEDLSGEDMTALSTRARRWLSLDWDPSSAVSVARPISPKIASLLRRGGGRFLRGSTFFEDFVKTLCTVNASWSFTEKMISRLVEDVGGGAFPGPEQVLDAGVRYLTDRARFGYRAKVLVDGIRALLDRGIMDDAGDAEPSLAGFEDLLSIKGIGPYAAAHIRVLMLDFRRIPSDSEVRPYCRERYGIDERDIDDFFEPWGEYRFLGYKLERIIGKTNWIGEPK